MRSPSAPFRWAALLAALGFAALQFYACGGGQGGTQWLNHSPNVQYVGTGSCSYCHSEIAETFALTGMGRSWYRPTRAGIIEDFGPRAWVYDTASGYAYRPYWVADTMFIAEYRLQGRDTAYRRTERVDYVVGSGNQTRSYVLDREGWLTEAPITWYVARGIWDLSPGYHGGQNSRFDRPIGQECMQCHNGTSTRVPGTLNRYTQVALGIGCEQCHGPGQEHIRRVQAGIEVDVRAGQADPSIVNPAKLATPELQMDVCQQCHLQGVAVPTGGPPYRPGMPLAASVALYVEQPADTAAFGIASHAGRLRLSRCFTGSGGRLTCTPCHDPHRPHTQQPTQHYNAACQGCHTPTHAEPAFRVPCPLPPAQQAAEPRGCIGCHIRSGGVSDIPHVSFTDHFIRRTPPALPAGHSPQRTDSLRRTVALLLATQGTPLPPATTGLAYLEYYERHSAQPQWLARAARELDSAPDVPPLALAKLRYYQNRPAEALAALAPLLQARSPSAPPLEPDVYLWQAELLALNGKTAEAQASLDAALGLHPAHPELTLKRVALLFATRQPSAAVLAQARRLLQAALAQKPNDKRLLANLGFVALNQRNTDEARRLLQAALAQDPLYAPALESLRALP